MTDLNEQAVLWALRDVIDPEIGLNVVELGLVYGVDIHAGSVRIRMTMTSPACPLGPMIVEQVDDIIRRRWPEISSVDVDVVWDPPWNAGRMSAAAREELGL